MLLAGAAIFFGCHFFLGGRQTEAMEVMGEVYQTQQEELAYYREQTVTLENQLVQLRLEQYQAKQAYEEQIAKLEVLLKAENEPQIPEAPPVTYTYVLKDEGATITGYSGESAQISIPSVIDGFEVVAIGREAFRNSQLEEITIPESVRLIDWFAFYSSPRLKKITVPPSVTKIEYGAFDGCTGLVVCCKENSYAEKYAKSYGISVSHSD